LPPILWENPHNKKPGADGVKIAVLLEGRANSNII
jgi:hypothetical protein